VCKISTVDKINRRSEAMLQLKEQGFSYAEIAEMYGISRQRVFQVITRDKGKLQECSTRKPLKATSGARERGLKGFPGRLLGRVAKALKI